MKFEPTIIPQNARQSHYFDRTEQKNMFCYNCSQKNKNITQRPLKCKFSQNQFFVKKKYRQNPSNLGRVASKTNPTMFSTARTKKIALRSLKSFSEFPFPGSSSSPSLLILIYKIYFKFEPNWKKLTRNMRCLNASVFKALRRSKKQLNFR